MIHSVVATNRLGDTFSFTKEARIVTGFDVSGLGADVNYLETTRPGSVYQNTILRNRELSLEVQLRRGFNGEVIMDAVRANMYRVFNPELNPIRFDFKTSDGEEYYLTAYALNTPIMRPDKGNDNAAFQRMLLQFTCTDPYIYQNIESRLELASYEGGLEFDWEIPQDGDVFEERTQNLNGDIYFTGTSEDGMMIRLVAGGTVVNPTITNLANAQYISLSTTMLNGDVIEISTYKGNRTITLIRNNNRINIFNTLNLPGSSFLQLRPGDNEFTYNATSGSDFLDIFIGYRIRKVGV